MARVKRANPFENRTNRFKHLKAGVYHQTTADEGVYLLYRRGPTKSMWYVRAHGGKQKSLALADDYQDADGTKVLTYFQAAHMALSKANDAADTQQDIEPRHGYSVDNAASAYLDKLRAEGRKSIRETERVINSDILAHWNGTPLAAVTRRKLNNWLEKLQTSAPKNRSGKQQKLDTSVEGKRKRRATAQRKWNIFRAVLNHAADLDWVTDRAWRGIKNLENTDPPVDDFPTLAECQRLARAVSAEFRPIVEATFMTGAAYGELIAIRVRDYTPTTGHVRIFNSKRQARHIPLTDEGIGLFDELSAGRSGGEQLIVHTDGRPWTKSEQARPIAAGNQKAKLDPPITLTRLRKAYGSMLLNAGVPLDVVSTAMGHSSVAVTKKHYARLLQRTVDDAIRDALPKLGIATKKIKRM